MDSMVFKTSPRPKAGKQWLNLPKAAVLLWTVLGILAVGRAALYHLPKHQGCYPIFAGAARNWQSGADLYDAANINSLSVYRYSPVVALLLAPLAWLTDPWGSAALRAVNLAVLLWGMWWWLQAWPATISRKARAGFYLLMAVSCMSSLMDVQFNILAIGLLLIATAAMVDERWWVAAWACSLAVCVKAYPISLALVLAALYPRRFGWRWLATMAMLLALPFLFQSPAYVWRQYDDWFHFGLNARYVDDYFHDFMLLCSRWQLPMSRSAYQVIEMLTGLAVAAICLVYRWRNLPDKPLLNLVFCLCCGWMMAFGPSTEPTTYIMLSPAMAAAVLLAWALPNPRWYRATVSISYALLTLSQLQLLLPLNKPLHQIAALPLAAVLFMVAVACRGMGDTCQPELLAEVPRDFTAAA